MFYSFLNNCVPNAYLIIEADNQTAADSKGTDIGLATGTDHGQWTKKDSDKSAPTINGTIIAEKINDKWVSTGSEVNGQVLFKNGDNVSF